MQCLEDQPLLSSNTRMWIDGILRLLRDFFRTSTATLRSTFHRERPRNVNGNKSPEQKQRFQTRCELLITMRLSAASTFFGTKNRKMHVHALVTQKQNIDGTNETSVLIQVLIPAQFWIRAWDWLVHIHYIIPQHRVKLDTRSSWLSTAVCIKTTLVLSNHTRSTRLNSVLKDYKKCLQVFTFTKSTRAQICKKKRHCCIIHSAKGLIHSDVYPRWFVCERLEPGSISMPMTPPGSLTHGAGQICKKGRAVLSVLCSLRLTHVLEWKPTNFAPEFIFERVKQDRK